jgi:hypothetical protein
MGFRTKIVSLIIIVIISISNAYSHSPMNRDFGFGLVLGEPTGISLAFVVAPNENLHVYAGNSYFGDAKIGADYQWYFDAFNSNIIHLYAGAGGFLGFGDGNDLFDRKRDKDNVDDLGIGARGMMGINFVPRNTSVEFFLELGLDAGVVPVNLFQPTGALGFRFYP